MFRLGTCRIYPKPRNVLMRAWFSSLFPSNQSINIGDKAPVFTAKNQSGEDVNVGDFVGKSKTVIFFYPKDFTPGCTKEVCSFRDNYSAFEKGNVKLIGVSADPVEKHLDFVQKYKLPFDLLADEGREARRLYGVKPAIMGAIDGRVTFAIDEDGTIIDIFDSTFAASNHVEAAKKAFKLV